MEDLVRKSGFESLKEFNEMIGQVDLSTIENINAFKDWQNNDGGKIGLVVLLHKQQNPEGYKVQLEGKPSNLKTK